MRRGGTGWKSQPRRKPARPALAPQGYWYLHSLRQAQGCPAPGGAGGTRTPDCFGSGVKAWGTIGSLGWKSLRGSRFHLTCHAPYRLDESPAPLYGLFTGDFPFHVPVGVPPATGGKFLPECSGRGCGSCVGHKVMLFFSEHVCHCRKSKWCTSTLLRPVGKEGTNLRIVLRAM